MEAGVSVMTVSNVINNNRGRVSPATEHRIREIMEKHHYVPNMAARSLISKSSRIIAVLLPMWHGTTSSMLLDPYIGQMVGYMEELLREKQYYVMLCAFENVNQVLMMQRTWQIDGMILSIPHEDCLTRELICKSQAPLVVFDRYFEDLDMLSVCLDDRKGGYQATHHLLEKGHTRIGFAAPSIEESSVIHDRYQGYLDALDEYGIEVNTHWVFEKAANQQGGEEVARLVCRMRNRPTAIVSTADLLACGIVKGCQARGMRIPEDLSVTGFDDAMPARLMTPELTTVAQDTRQKVETGVQMLLRAIEDPSYRNEYRVMDVSLVQRQSVAEITEKDE